MTHRTSARLAGAAFLLYIVFGIAQMSVFGAATRGDTATARVAAAAQHLGAIRLAFALSLLSACCAFALALSLYALTRQTDRELALFGFGCRLIEGAFGAIPLTAWMFLWLANTNGGRALDAASISTIVPLVLKASAWRTSAASWLFAIGSTAFSIALLRGRVIAEPLAWVGVIASLVLVVGVPLDSIGYLNSTLAALMWLPMLAFEVPVGFYFLVKGAAAPRATIVTA